MLHGPRAMQSRTPLAHGVFGVILSCCGVLASTSSGTCRADLLTLRSESVQPEIHQLHCQLDGIQFLHRKSVLILSCAFVQYTSMRSPPIAVTASKSHAVHHRSSLIASHEASAFPLRPKHIHWPVRYPHLQTSSQPYHVSTNVFSFPSTRLVHAARRVNPRRCLERV